MFDRLPSSSSCSSTSSSESENDSDYLSIFSESDFRDSSDNLTSSSSYSDISESENVGLSDPDPGFPHSKTSSSVDSDSNSERLTKRRCHRQPYRCSVENHFKVYALDPPTSQFDYQTVLSALYDQTTDLFDEIDCQSIKFSLTILCAFKREIDDIEDEEQETWFRSQCVVKINDETLPTLISDATDQLATKIQNFIQLGSGWIFRQCKKATVEVSVYSPLSGGSHITACKLPKQLNRTRSLLNIKCSDNKCFLYSVIANFYPADPKDKSINSSRPSCYKPHADKFNMSKIEYPVKLSDISKVRYKLGFAKISYFFELSITLKFQNNSC